MDTILTEVKNYVGTITLNAEKSLNALSLNMIEHLSDILETWKDSEDIACIFLQGAGNKAFCAGGDIRQLQLAILETNEKSIPKICEDFFSKEYTLDYTIHKYPKPIIVWGDGIIMGGGVGLFNGASHRIVTERTKFAMPEITIGLFPDVGATWFLNKLPSSNGLYLGLTATRLDGADCLYLGLADFLLKSTEKETLLDQLHHVDWSKEANKEELVSNILNILNTPRNEQVSKIETHQPFIKLFEQARSIDEFHYIINAYPEKDNSIEAGLKTFQNGSPSSANIIFRQLEQGKNFSLEEVFQSELNLACQCCIHPDFSEGVRALLIDKDGTPNWKPSSLNKINKEWIDSYFQPLWTADKHPLRNLGKT